MKIKNIIFIALLYLTALLTFIFTKIQNSDGTLAWIFFLLLAVICLFAIASIIVTICTLPMEENYSFKTVLIFKLIQIPFFVLNFFFYLGVAIVAMFPLFTIPALVFLFIGIVETYLIMLVTSAELIRLSIKSAYKKQVPISSALIPIIMSLFFCLDIVAAIIAVVQNKNKKINGLK